MGTPLLSGISARVLEELAAALRSGRLAWPATAISLKAKGYSGMDGLHAGLKALATQFPAVEQGAAVLSMLAEERGASEAEARRRVDLVWSGPEGKGQSLDTAIVIGELFANAKRKVWMSTYNVGWKRGLFAPLIDKMERDSAFDLTMFVHIDKELTKVFVRSGEDPVNAFRRWFLDKHWSGGRRPNVFYDPRAMRETRIDPVTGYEMRAPKLHAKCVIVDDELALVTSANFSDAAQNDNIEAGVIVTDARFARALAQQFEGLLATKQLERVI